MIDFKISKKYFNQNSMTWDKVHLLNHHHKQQLWVVKNYLLGNIPGKNCGT